MKEEREGGFIDDNMNFVFKKEKEEVDAWVADLKENEMQSAITASAIAEKRRQARLEQQEMNRRELDAMSELDLKLELLSYMQPKETVTNTLRRLGGQDSGKQLCLSVVTYLTVQCGAQATTKVEELNEGKHHPLLLRMETPRYLNGLVRRRNCALRGKTR